jgi:hypothetical protein
MVYSVRIILSLDPQNFVISSEAQDSRGTVPFFHTPYTSVLPTEWPGEPGWGP